MLTRILYSVIVAGAACFTGCTAPRYQELTKTTKDKIERLQDSLGKEKDPQKKIRSHLDLAQMCVDTERFFDAGLQYIYALDVSPNNSEAKEGLDKIANELTNRRNSDSAKLAKRYFTLGDKIREGRTFDPEKYKEGVAYLKRSIELDPTNIKAYQSLYILLRTTMRMSSIGPDPEARKVERMLHGVGLRFCDGDPSLKGRYNTIKKRYEQIKEFEKDTREEYQYRNIPVKKMPPVPISKLNYGPNFTNQQLASHNGSNDYHLRNHQRRRTAC